MMMRIGAALALLLALPGCASNPQAWMYTEAGERFQLVELGGKPYFLDQHSGKLYLVEPQADGKLRLDRLAGEVGKAP